MKKIIIFLLLIVVIIFDIGTPRIYADNDTINTIVRVDDDTHGILKNISAGWIEQNSFEIPLSKDGENHCHVHDCFVDIVNNESTITLFATPKDGYLFLNWSINGEVIVDTDVYYSEDIEIVANYEKDITIYWGLGVDNLDQFVFSDDSEKYTLYLSSQKELIDNYDGLSQFEYYDIEYDETYLLPLAGEQSFVVDDVGGGWNWLTHKIDEVMIVGDINVRSTANWFCCFYPYSENKLDTFKFDLAGLKNVKDISGMFANFCVAKKIEISGLDTSMVTSMSNLFGGSEFLSIDISNLNTLKVTNMHRMFYDCSYLQSINFGENFDTSNVTDFEFMFSNCESLEQLDLSSFNTSKATSFYCMFSGCCSLKELDLSSFDTSNVDNMFGMFSGCHSLEKIDVGNFDTSNVNEFGEMFRSCFSLKELDLTSFTFEKIDQFGWNYFLSSMYNLETVYASDSFNSSIAYTSVMFGEYSGDVAAFYDYNLKGENGTYIAPYDEETGYGFDIDDDKSMFHLDKENSASSKYARIDDPKNDKPGYFTRGYSVILNYDNGKKKRITNRFETEILLPRDKKEYYVFAGWSDGTNLYTDRYTLLNEVVNLYPVWKEDIKVDCKIDDLVYNGDIQNPLPKVLTGLPDTYYDASYSQVNSNDINIDCILPGKYIASITLKESAISEGYIFVLEDGTRSYEYDIEFSITKRPLTINIDSKNIYVNENVPSFTYNQNGLIKDNIIDLKLICDANNKSVGKYLISVDGQIVIYDKNKKDITNYYEITINSGVLNVISKITPYIPPKTGNK